MKAIASPAGSRSRGVAQACTICYQKKIRCDLSTGKKRCSNCALYNTECLPRLRKRKRTASSVLSEHDCRRMSPPPLSAVLSPEPFETHNEPMEPAPEPSFDDSQVLNSTATPAGTSQTSPTGEAHDGKAVYFGPMENRVVEATSAYPQTPGLSAAEMAALQREGAFVMPSRALKACYVDNFFRHCSPWVPVVEEAWLRETPEQKPSALLMQAVLLAGSRVTTPHDIALSGEIYARAKALFFSNYEQNPVIRIVACLLLRWWNPTGPDRVSIDSSHFWISTGVGIAISIGLHVEGPRDNDVSYRRRLWWSLLAHDAQISAVHGRPGSIHAEDFTVSPLTLRDFPRDAPRARASIAFVGISRILGDLGQRYRRKQMTLAAAENLQNALYAWVRELPDHLRLFHPRVELGPCAYSFEGRQLHVMFFVNLVLLFRASGTENVSAGSLLAASFVAALYEEFLVRDEVGHLGPAVHKFFLLAAGITLLAARRYPLLASAAEEDFAIIVKALRQFSTRHPSALGTIRTLENLQSSRAPPEPETEALQPPPPSARPLFREFGPDLCRQWHLMDVDAPVARDPTPPEVPASRLDLDPPADIGDSYDLTIPDLDSLWPCYWPDMPGSTDWILRDTPFEGP